MSTTTTTQQPVRVSRGRKWLFRLGLVFFGLCFAVLIAEVGLRILGVRYATFGAVDENRGWALMPGIEEFQTIEGEAQVKINGNGYRDAERTHDKPEGVYRIAVLGDSFVEARQVDLQDTFCSRLEKKLNEAGTYSPHQVEVLNFGVSGYGTAQEFLTLQHDVLSFHPDAVLLCFFSGNDILENSRELDVDSRKEMRPFYAFAGDDFQLDNSFRQSANFQRRSSLIGQTVYFLRNHSRIVQLVVGTMFGPADTRNSAPHTMKDEVGLSTDVYKEPTDPVWANSWKVTDRLMAEMNRFCEERSIGFGVVTLTAGSQVYPDAKKRQELIDELKVPDLFYPEHRIAGVGKQAGFPVLNLAQPMQQEADRDGTFFHGFKNTEMGWGHWNPTGHEFVATQIASWLADPGVRSQIATGTVSNTR